MADVYSLRSFVPVEFPYPVLRGALGSGPRDVFQGLRLIRDERAGHVLDALGVSTTTSTEQELNDARRAARELANDVGEEARLPPEQTHSTGGSYLLGEREVIFRRVESLLVQSYRNSLPPDAAIDHIRCKAGLIDLCVTIGDSTEVLEAKAHASHPYVRQALGQILDYTHSITAPIATIAALFPSRAVRRRHCFAQPLRRRLCLPIGIGSIPTRDRPHTAKIDLEDPIAQLEGSLPRHFDHHGRGTTSARHTATEATRRLALVDVDLR